MRKELVFVSLLFLSTLFSPDRVFAQCAMCTLNAENSVKNGNTQGAGLNAGILYLLAAPFIAVAGVGFVWYTKYRFPEGSDPLKKFFGFSQ